MSLLCTGASRYVPGGLSSQSGFETSSASDPFTGAGRYQPQTWGSGSTGVSSSGLGGAADPFTGEPAYSVIYTCMCRRCLIYNMRHTTCVRAYTAPCEHNVGETSTCSINGLQSQSPTSHPHNYYINVLPHMHVFNSSVPPPPNPMQKLKDCQTRVCASISISRFI